MTFEELPNHLVLFDGECTMCNGAVGYVFDLDKNDLFYYTSLHSSVGKMVVTRLNAQLQGVDSVVYLLGDQLYTRSTAFLQISRRLRYVWPLYYLIYVPLPIRDGIYDWIARNRHRWFGRSKNCRLHSAVLRQRILE